MKRIIWGLMLILWGWYGVLSNQKFKVVFCDVGQGDATLISRGYSQILIDTGSKKGGINSCLSKYMPLGDNNLETVIISHWDDDHSGAIDLIKRYYRIENIFGLPKDGVNPIYAGDNLVDKDLSLRVVFPEKGKIFDENDSVMILLEYKGTKILFTGDSNWLVEEELLDKAILPRGIDILKISHHGSETANSEIWLQYLVPKWSVISVGKNAFGHPHKRVLELIGKIESKVMRTDEKGDIVFVEN